MWRDFIQKNSRLDKSERIEGGQGIKGKNSSPMSTKRGTCREKSRDGNGWVRRNLFPF